MTPQHVIIIVSALGGIIGGMGMGGGTLLIPLLTLFSGVEQHLAQAINLISFVPMSLVALFIHKKNGYVRVKTALPIALTAVVGAVCGSFAAKYAGGYALRAAFGAFLIVLGVYQAIKTIVQKVREKHGERASATAHGAKRSDYPLH